MLSLQPDFLFEIAFGASGNEFRFDRTDMESSEFLKWSAHQGGEGHHKQHARQGS